MQLNHLRRKIRLFVFKLRDRIIWDTGERSKSFAPKTDNRSMPSVLAMASSIFLSVFLLSGVVFADEFSAFTGQISADNINVRVDSTVGSAVVCTLAKGQLVEVASELYDWYKIRLPKSAPSYIKQDLVECIGNTAAKCSNGKVTGNRVNIRLGPSESSPIIGGADNSTVVNIIQEEGSWYKIEPVHQSYGWVHKKLVNKDISVVKTGEKDDMSLQPEVLESGTHPGGSQPSARQQLVVEGTISPYGVVLWRKATHKLVTGEKGVYLLKGNRKALDSLNYHKVKVTGKIINPENKRYPIIEVAVIEVLN
ncbi:MAG: SH3 domain-containing protein [Candidatus Omnitrophica bacterium]|nr:SH3 domain-containing protein [Candidatus Omnitrophota bacterium]